MSEKISKYTAPVVFVLLGLMLIIFSLSSGQNNSFLLGGISVFLVGVIAVLNALDKLENKISLYTSVFLIALSGFLTVSNYKSIKDPLDFLKERDRRYQYVIQRLKDIRQAQLQFKDKYGVYADNFNSLIAFIQQDSINVVKTVGSIPDSLDERQAILLGLVSLDTSKIPAKEYIYTPKYLAERKFGKLYIDSLRFVPFTTTEFSIDAGSIERNKVAVQVFEVIDAAPFDPKKVLSVGSMSEPSTAGNWGE